MENQQRRKKWVSRLKHPKLKISDEFVTLRSSFGSMKLKYDNKFFEENVLNFLKLEVEKLEKSSDVKTA